MADKIIKINVKEQESKVKDTEISSAKLTEPSLDVLLSGYNESWVQEPRIGKFLSDLTTLRDAVVLKMHHVRVYRDAVASSDKVVLVQQNRHLYEDKSLANAVISFGAEKVLKDLTQALDSFNRKIEFFRSYVEEIVASDVTKQNVGKKLLDKSDVGDWHKLSVLPVYKDILRTADSFDRVVQYYRTLRDTADATDDVMGQANLDDEQYMSFFKVVMDFHQADETFSILLSRIIQEELSSADRVLRSA